MAEETSLKDAFILTGFLKNKQGVATVKFRDTLHTQARIHLSNRAAPFWLFNTKSDKPSLNPIFERNKT